MTQIVAGYGPGWLVVAADRIVTEVDTESGKVLGRWIRPTSKLVVTQGYPIVLTATGPDYANNLISEYISEKAFTQETGAVSTAQTLWPLLTARHKDGFGQRELRLASMSFFAGAVDSIGVARVVTAEYPREDVDLTFVPKWGNELVMGAFGSGFVLMGIHNARWGVNFDGMSPEQGIEATRAAIGTVLQMEAFRRRAGSTDVVAEPFDMIVVTRDGAKWVQQAQV